MLVAVRRATHHTASHSRTLVTATRATRTLRAAPRAIIAPHCASSSICRRWMAQRAPHKPAQAEPQPPAASSAAATLSSPAIAASAASSTADAVATPGAATAHDSAADDDDEAPPGSSWWRRWTHERAMPPRWSSGWWREMALIFTVFGITGSGSMYIVRPMLHWSTGLEGSMREGPWSYRLVSLAVLMPAYSLMLVTIGTIAGRHHYFKRAALRMWGRLLPLHKLGIKARPPPKARREVIDSTTSTKKD